MKQNKKKNCIEKPVHLVVFHRCQFLFTCLLYWMIYFLIENLQRTGSFCMDCCGAAAQLDVNTCASLSHSTIELHVGDFSAIYARYINNVVFVSAKLIIIQWRYRVDTSSFKPRIWISFPYINLAYVRAGHRERRVFESVYSSTKAAKVLSWRIFLLFFFFFAKQNTRTRVPRLVFVTGI